VGKFGSGVGFYYVFFVILERENIGYTSAFRTSFRGQVVCNPSFCGRQIARSHGKRLVVHSLVATSPFLFSLSIHLTVLIMWFAYI